MDSSKNIGWRIWAWAKLVKVWASLRWSDLQAMVPGEMTLHEGLLTTILRRTKTTGAAFFEDRRWLTEGFDLLKGYGYGLQPGLPDAPAEGERPAGEEDGYLCGRDGGYRRAAGYGRRRSGSGTQREGAPPHLAGPQADPPSDRGLLGRWKPEGSDIYMRA